MLKTICGGLIIPPMPAAISGQPSITGVLCDAANEGIAAIVRAPKTGSIRKVWWRVANLTTGSTLDVRLETVNTAANPATPSGTLLGTNTRADQVVGANDDNTVFVTQLLADANVTLNDYLAIVVKQPATGFGNANICVFDDDILDFPYALHFTTTWALRGDAPMFALEYSDGSYCWIPACWPMSATNIVSFNNTSTPDERGLRFRLPFKTQAYGFWAYYDPDADCNWHLYGSDGVTKLATVAVNANARGSAAQAMHAYQFAPVTLNANTWYRLVCEPTTASNLSINDFDVNAAAVLDAHPGGQDFHYTQAKDPTGEGSWTNTLTKRPFCGLFLSGFDDGVSLQPGFARGFN